MGFTVQGKMVNGKDAEHVKYNFDKIQKISVLNVSIAVFPESAVCVLCLDFPIISACAGG